VLNQKVLRITPSPSEHRKERLPSNPTNGSTLPVFGSSGAAAAAGTGVGSATATKIGASAGGGGGGGGIEPVSCF
jgi:hypothetical protein